jgi:hypothetical protein
MLERISADSGAHQSTTIMEQKRSTRDEESRLPYSDKIMAHIRQRLEEISDSQIDISSARKQLLVKRERLRTASRVVQLKRVDAGDAEAAFMTRVREFVNENPGQLSAPLMDAYREVEETRDNLGEIEQNYLEAESDLTGAEWKFMDQEDRFYQWDIHSIIPEENDENAAMSVGELNENSPNLPAYSTPLHSTGSQGLAHPLDSPYAPPPPPTHGPFTSHDLATSSSITNVNQGYATMMAEVDTLKREFDQLRHKQACELAWEESHDLFLPGSEEFVDGDLNDSSNGCGDIVYKICIREAKAQRFKVESMIPALDASKPTRRYSDTAHSIRPATICSTAMRRTQTESAASSLRDHPTAKQKIREWSLFHLKESAVHKQVYLNTLQEHGVSSPVEGDWKARATQFWGNDSSVESGEGSESDGSVANGSGYEPGSCHELSIRRSVASPSSVQYLQEDDVRETGQVTTITEPNGSQEVVLGDQNTVLTSSSPLLLLPRHQVTENTHINSGGPTTTPIVYNSHEQQGKAKNGVTTDTLTMPTPCVCSMEINNAAERKDSVQTSSVTPHSDCATARKCNNEKEAHYAAAENTSAEVKTESTTVDEAGTQSQQDQSANLSLPLPPTHSWRTGDFGPSDLGDVVQPASSRLSNVLPAPSALIHEIKAQSPESPTMPQYRPISQGRRGTTSWLRNLLPTTKSKRSKSTSSIGGHHPFARFGKHPAA